MKKLCYLFIGLMFIGLCGCNEQKQQQKVLTDTLGFDTIIEDSDTTIYGKCGEGTAMHSLELITTDGDTLLLMIDDDSIPIIKGGLSVGDRLAVTVRPAGPDDDTDGDIATQVINITTLLGKWSALDKTFELFDDGAVICNVNEPKPITAWRIFNGHFLLSTDTFDIYELGADTLYLENRDGIFVYKRIKQ